MEQISPCDFSIGVPAFISSLEDMLSFGDRCFKVGTVNCWFMGVAALAIDGKDEEPVLLAIPFSAWPS